MEIPVYFRIDSYVGKPNKNLIHFWRHEPNYNRPLDIQTRRGIRCYNGNNENHNYAEISEQPLENNLVVFIDNEKNDIENCEYLADQFDQLKIDFENKVAVLNQNHIELPTDLYFFHDATINEIKTHRICATFFSAILNHFRIHEKEFYRNHARTIPRSGILEQLFQMSVCDLWKINWIYLRSEYGEVKEARKFNSLKGAVKFANKYLLETFGFEDKLDWHKGQMFVRDNTLIQLVKATV